MARKERTKKLRTNRLKREMRLKASDSLLVSLSICGADRLAAPKLLISNAKNRFNTCNSKGKYRH